MIPESDWMVPADVLILWFMSEHRFRMVSTPKVVSKNLGVLSSSHANRRMRFLQEAGLLDSVEGRGYYRISEDGYKLIRGHMKKEDLEARDPT